MKYVKIVNNIVEQVQPNSEVGFIEVEDYVICGMIDNLDGTFSNPSQTIEQAKASKLSQINLDYEASENEPVVYNGISYAGGTESVTAIDGYVRLNRLAGITTHSIWDVNGTEHSLSDAEADGLLLAIGSQASANKFTKKNRKVALLLATTIAEVEAI